MSTDCAVKCGVPQGSVLGPILYSRYTRPIGDSIARHRIRHQLCLIKFMTFFGVMLLLKSVIDVSGWFSYAFLESDSDSSSMPLEGVLHTYDMRCLLAVFSKRRKQRFVFRLLTSRHFLGLCCGSSSHPQPCTKKMSNQI